MVEVFVDPVGEVVKFPEVYDKAVFVEFVAGKSNGDGPSCARGCVSNARGVGVGGGRAGRLDRSWSK